MDPCDNFSSNFIKVFQRPKHTLQLDHEPTQLNQLASAMAYVGML